MTEEQFARERIELGARVHQHDGVWWEQVNPWFARPAFRFRPVVPGAARPAPGKALLVYSHHVPEVPMANWHTDYMVLEGEDLREFSLDRLPAKKRNQVRKGLKLCEIRPLTDLEPWLEEARSICASHAERLADSRAAFHATPAFFRDHAETWRQQMRRDFAAPGRSWWGAFAEDRLIGYIATLAVDSVRVLHKLKLHSDGLARNPSDALYFVALEHASHDPACHRVFNSPPQPKRPELDRFKEQFLFKPRPIPFYISRPSVYRWASYAATWRERLHAWRSRRQEV
jgi:hypothetical protein